jgi:hypothetical protein
MSETWNIAPEAIPDAEKVMQLALAGAYHSPDGLEGLALFVSGAGAPKEWRDKVRTAAADLISQMANINAVTSEAVGSIGRALALVRENG